MDYDFCRLYFEFTNGIITFAVWAHVLDTGTALDTPTVVEQINIAFPFTINESVIYVEHSTEGPLTTELTDRVLIGLEN